jgi:uncharacterized repeat protein (TIGR03803 family)
MKNPWGIAVLALFSVLSAAGHSQTVKGVLSFSNAMSSYGGGVTFAEGRDGRLYGTTDGFSSMTYPDGTIFRINPDGSGATVLFSLSGTNGQLPAFGMTLAVDGNYYGTTLNGGAGNSGVLFKVSPTGSYTPLHEFSGATDGALPVGLPIQASDGNIYGVTTQGSGSDGTVYKYVPSTGTFSTILGLSSDGSQGNSPSASLMQASDGSLYGTTQGGGTSNCGTVFRLNTSGVLLHVYSFPCGLGGNAPQAPLYQASDGNLYGTTVLGGKVDSSGDCKKGCGTVFRVSHGIVSVVYRFSGYPNDGGLATTGLMEGTDGNLYGGTDRGGANDFGTLYQVTTTGQYKLLYSFVDAIGNAPFASLIQHTSGKFYGTTAYGGLDSYGALYSLDMGLGPFIALVRYTGRIGQPVQILGQGLKGSMAVTINGVAATSFKVVSDTYMTAVIPTGATTGPVIVTTPTGTLTSNHNLRIVQ